MNIECWRRSGYTVEIEDLELPYALLMYSCRGTVANAILVGVDIIEYSDLGFIGVMRWTGTLGDEHDDSILDTDGEWIPVDGNPPIPESLLSYGMILPL